MVKWAIPEDKVINLCPVPSGLVNEHDDKVIVESFHNLSRRQAHHRCVGAWQYR